MQVPAAKCNAACPALLGVARTCMSLPSETCAAAKDEWHAHVFQLICWQPGQKILVLTARSAWPVHRQVHNSPLNKQLTLLLSQLAMLWVCSTISCKAHLMSLER